MQIQETEPSKAIRCRWKIQTAPVSRTWRGNTAEGRPGDVPGRRREYASLSRTFLAPGQRALRADLECIAAPAPGGRPDAGGTAPSAPSRLHQLHASAAHNAERIRIRNGCPSSGTISIVLRRFGGRAIDAPATAQSWSLEQ